MADTAVHVIQTNAGDLTDDEIKVARKFGISNEDVLRCREAFRTADKDKSGYVSAQELRDLLDTLSEAPMTDEEFLSITRVFGDSLEINVNFESFVECFISTPHYREGHLEEMIDALGKGTRKGMHDERRTPGERAQTEGVPLPALIYYLESEVEQMAACKQLPFVMIIFLSFASAVLLHERVHQLHAIDMAISWDIEENANFAFGGNIPFDNGRMGHKDITNVNTPADFWSWFNIGLVPLFWREGWDVSEVRLNVLAKCENVQDAIREMGYNSSSVKDVPTQGEFSKTCPETKGIPSMPRDWEGTPKTPLFLFYFAVVGGMRMQQERTLVQPCASESGFVKSVFTGVCTDDPGYWLSQEPRLSLYTKEWLVDREGGRNIYLRSGVPQREIREITRKLEDDRWFDPLTAKVSLLYTLYNPHIGSFTAVHVIMSQNRAGHIHRMVQPVTFWVDNYPSVWNYVADILWLLTIMKIMMDEFVDFKKYAGKYGLVTGFQLYFSISNMVDWMNVLYGAVLVFLWALHLQRVNALVADYLQDASVTVQGSWMDESQLAQFYSQVDDIVIAGLSRRIMISLYPFVLISRFFKAFSAQPRLSLVTSTITRAFVDLVHFGLVFMSVFMLFTLSAIVLFGQDLEVFATVDRAADSAFHVLLGDFDWEHMREVGRAPAIVWFWSFMWLVNMVLLNMLLAIVMDVYTEVKGNIGSNAETLWSQANEIFRRWRERRAGRRVGLPYILRCVNPDSEFVASRVNLEELEGSRMINVKSLCAMVPSLSEKQAERSLTAAQELFEASQQKSESMAETLRDIQRIHRRLTQMHGSMQSLIHMNELTTSLITQREKKDRTLTRQAEAEQAAALHEKNSGKERKAQHPVELLEGMLTQHSSEVNLRCDRLEARVSEVTAEVSRLAKLLEASLIPRGGAPPAPMPPARPLSWSYCSDPARAAPEGA
eukprot:TRINITY_DN20208_c0_g1_i1.p1 TRINITY_DN20208_c0_g1~~TRINITY_DN20208_c0_g1_i1.p1  ORF type:complete len:945 (-),score=150.40 TRINITY_DN20208_c0_g1_i1:298-3132(-)